MAVNGSLVDKVIVVTGGTGVLLTPTVAALLEEEAKVVLVSRSAKADSFPALARFGSQVQFLSADVVKKKELESVRDLILADYGRVDILINGAGGNQSNATTSDERTFFDLEEESVRGVVNVNFLGTFFACQVFGSAMAESEGANILNISSMAAISPLTRIVAYSAAKAAVDNFTKWLAVNMAQTFDGSIRVNAIAPGFILTKQNEYLLLTEGGTLTERGQHIIQATPMGRFGTPEEMVGTILWLISEAAAFVTGVVVPVDGGFSAFGGV